MNESTAREIAGTATDTDDRQALAVAHINAAHGGLGVSTCDTCERHALGLGFSLRG